MTYHYLEPNSKSPKSEEFKDTTIKPPTSTKIVAIDDAIFTACGIFQQFIYRILIKGYHHKIKLPRDIYTFIENYNPEPKPIPYDKHNMKKIEPLFFFVLYLYCIEHYYKTIQNIEHPNYSTFYSTFYFCKYLLKNIKFINHYTNPYYKLETIYDTYFKKNKNFKHDINAIIDDYSIEIKNASVMRTPFEKKTYGLLNKIITDGFYCGIMYSYIKPSCIPCNKQKKTVLSRHHSRIVNQSLIVTGYNPKNNSLVAEKFNMCDNNSFYIFNETCFMFPEIVYIQTDNNVQHEEITAPKTFLNKSRMQTMQQKITNKIAPYKGYVLYPSRPKLNTSSTLSTSSTKKKGWFGNLLNRMTRKRRRPSGPGTYTRYR